MRKLMLTGVLIFFFPETPSQILVGLLVAFASSLVYCRLNPFTEDEDNLLSNLTQCQTYFAFFAALVSFISSDEYVNANAESGGLYSEALFGWLLVGVGLVSPVFAVVLIARKFVSGCQVTSLCGAKEGVAVSEERAAETEAETGVQLQEHHGSSALV